MEDALPLLGQPAIEGPALLARSPQQGAIEIRDQDQFRALR